MRTRRPFFWKGSHESFRIHKRRQWKAVMKAFSEFSSGCAYVPGYKEYHSDIEALIKKQHEILRGDWK